MTHSFLAGFTLASRVVGPDSIRINYAVGGQEKDPPILLIHGHPQTHATWHTVGPRLAESGYRVIAADLRGYGDSEKPDLNGDPAAYSKRAMAADLVALMRTLGHRRFAVLGHDRGGRVAHRMAIDHADAIDCLTLLDIAPTLTMFERTDMTFAMAYFWWFFLAQPEPLPEKMIGADPEHYLRHHLKVQSRTDGVPSEDMVREYLRCYSSAEGIHAICEDYRAAAGIDLEHDRSDRKQGRMVSAPVLVLWGVKGTVGQLYDVLETWSAVADRVSGRGLPCGHLIQEEAPADLLAEVLPFLTAWRSQVSN